MTAQDIGKRFYLSSSRERARRHIRNKGAKALLSAVSVTAVIAGLLSAAGIRWPLLAYVGTIAALSLLFLWVLSLAAGPSQYLMLLPGIRSRPPAARSPKQLEVLPSGHARPISTLSVALVKENRCDDPVYGAGLMALTDSSCPIVIVPSNPRDVGKPHELLYPLFVGGASRSRIAMDLRPLGLRLPILKFERELPEGAQDPDHTLAIKDLAFVPDLVTALRDVGAVIGSPTAWPEHCVDPLLIAERDVVVVGGPDTNFWHAALFEAVAHEFETPASSVPLAIGLRDVRGGDSVYGSRSLLINLKDPAELPRQDGTRIELDERLFPTYGMILACRNPFAAARGLSRWCVFVAGTRSLGTSGAVMALAAILRAMSTDSSCNFTSAVRTSVDGVHAQVGAILCRTSEVEHAAIRREGLIVGRARQRLNPVGLDPLYSDTYMPTEVQYLRYVGANSAWETLCLIPEEESESRDHLAR